MQSIKAGGVKFEDMEHCVQEVAKMNGAFSKTYNGLVSLATYQSYKFK